MEVHCRKESRKRKVADVSVALIAGVCLQLVCKPDGGTEGETAAETKDRAQGVMARMMLKPLYPATNEMSRREFEAGFLCVSNLIRECGIGRNFTRLDEGVAFMTDVVAGCDGAYGEIPYFMAMDDQYANGGAMFPEANKDNTNVVEFVSIANRVVSRGRFEYDLEFGFVMYKLALPVSAICNAGKQALGMVCGFPALEVDLMSDAYKDVLYGRKKPQEAMATVREKLEKEGGD